MPVIFNIGFIKLLSIIYKSQLKIKSLAQNNNQNTTKENKVSNMIDKIFLELRIVTCKLFNTKTIITNITACKPKIPVKESIKNPANNAKV